MHTNSKPATLATAIATACLFTSACQAQERTGSSRTDRLWSSTRQAVEAGHARVATRDAQAPLRANFDPRQWYFGDVIHEGNQLLGLAAVRDGNVTLASHYLLLAGKTPGSPQLNTFGPHMVLAQRLLGRGQKAVVVRYLDLVGRFWAQASAAQLRSLEGRRPGAATLKQKMNLLNKAQVDYWKRQISAGQKPHLNLRETLG